MACAKLNHLSKSSLGSRCNVLVTTRDKGYLIKLTQSRTHVTSREIVFVFLVLGRDLVELL